MKFNSFASMFRLQAVGLDDGSDAVTDADIVLFTNMAKDSLARDIVTNSDGDADYFSITLETDLIADQREYSFPVDTLKDVKIARAYLNGKWKRLSQFDINSYRVVGENEKPYNEKRVDDSFSDATTDETTITEQFTDDNPMFDIDGQSFVIYSETITAVTDGLKIKAMIYPADYDTADFSTSTEISTRDSSQSTAMPRQTHDVLLRKAVIDYKESKEIPLTAFDKNYLQEKQLMLDSLRDIGLDETFAPKIPRDDGFNY